jgi:imidazolonepropionase-like amidohydrolase
MNRFSRILTTVDVPAMMVSALLALLLFNFAFRVSAESLLLENAIVHTVSGATITNGSVLIEDGKITGVFDGKNPTRTRLPGQRMDLQGRHLYPGMISLDSALGLAEIEAVRATQDTTEVGDYTPDVQSWIAVNPDSQLIPVARVNGVTHAEPAPQGGVVAGLSGLIQLDGWTTEQMTVKKPAALHLYWPSMALDTTPAEKFKDPSKHKSLEDQAAERAKKLKAMDEFFLEAKAYAKAREVAATNGANLATNLNPPWEAMLPVVRGEIPIMVHAADIREMKAAMNWAQTNGYKIILVTSGEVWRIAELIASNQVPVVFEGVFNQPQREYDAYDANFKAPEALRKAGVKFAIGMGQGNMGAQLAKNLPYTAAQAVAYGLPESEALKAITLYPAQLLRVADRLGSIEPGKEATFFVSDGDILDIRVNVTQVWIAGHEISLDTRHTWLYGRYKNRPLPK